MTTIAIRNHTDLLAAMQRDEELAKAANDVGAQGEREEIAAAILRYEETLTMMREVADKAADEETEGVAGISGAE